METGEMVRLDGPTEGYVMITDDPNEVMAWAPSLDVEGIECTIKDTLQENDPVHDFTKQLWFKNGYGISVLRYIPKYDLGWPWEIAVISGDPNGEWHLDYGTSVTDDVEHLRTVEEVKECIIKVSELEAY